MPQESQTKPGITWANASTRSVDVSGAIRAWAHRSPDDLSRIRHPVLVANGDQDKMVPSSNSVDLARRLNLLRLVADGRPTFLGLFVLFLRSIWILI
jgi:pimeloyl-ACP methyl ester carboxylesterase